jgi:predicted nucleic acid-binding protein
MAVMPILAQFLRRHRVLAADTMVFIYHLQEHPRYVPATQVILDAWEAGSHQGVTSIITLAEVLVKPLRDGNDMAAEDYRRLLTTFPNLRLYDVTQSIAEAAARLRAVHGQPMPDMIQIATAVIAGATGFVSNDPTFKRIKDLEILMLDDVVPARR